MNIFLIILAYIISFTLVLLSIPTIINVSNAKSLYSIPGGRNIHTRIIPTLGGVAVFIGFMISSLILSDFVKYPEVKILLVAVIMMFFIGIKDDIMVISAKKKLAVQLIASLLLIVVADVRFTNFYGIFGIGELNYLFSVFFTLFVITVIINAFNLIDGIDGLASGIAILASSVLGFWFYLYGCQCYSVLSFTLAGSLCAFFLFNVFGHKNKIFLGDTGSLIIGVIISVLIIKFNKLNTEPINQFSIQAAPAVSIAIIIAPLIDTIRVFTIRIIQGRSPFLPDKNHIHHHLLKVYEGHHLKTTLTMLCANALIIALAFWLDKIGAEVNILLLIIIALAIYFAYIPMVLNKNRESKLVRPSFLKVLREIIL